MSAAAREDQLQDVRDDGGGYRPVVNLTAGLLNRLPEEANEAPSTSRARRPQRRGELTNEVAAVLTVECPQRQREFSDLSVEALEDQRLLIALSSQDLRVAAKCGRDRRKLLVPRQCSAELTAIEVRHADRTIDRVVQVA